VIAHLQSEIRVLKIILQIRTEGARRRCDPRPIDALADWQADVNGVQPVPKSNVEDSNLEGIADQI
jgi:hypothetical protein